jgi:hypothetical protein
MGSLIGPLTRQCADHGFKVPCEQARAQIPGVHVAQLQVDVGIPAARRTAWTHHASRVVVSMLQPKDLRKYFWMAGPVGRIYDAFF